MQPGEVLSPDQPITSANGRYRFVYQGDGNLVLYDGGTPLWASGTDGQPGRRLHHAGRRQPGRSTTPAGSRSGRRTPGNPGSRLVVQDDGNVVIYRPDGTPVWATDTWLPQGPAAQGDDMQPGEVLTPTSRSRRRTAATGSSTRATATSCSTTAAAPLWASNTDGRPVGVCIMQGDGNLVIYARGGAADLGLRHLADPGSRLVVQDDGNVVIYRPDGTPVWATNTVQS